MTDSDDGPSAATRLLRISDAETLADVLVRNREFLAPWEPVRPDEYFTSAGQAAIIEASLRRHEQGTELPHAILDEARVVGRITLSGIVRAPFLSCSVGYWVDRDCNGKGLSTAAVAQIKVVAL